MQKIYQFHKIIDFIVGFFILYISFFTNKCQSIIEYIGIIFFILAIIYCCGFSYSFNNETFTKYWYFYKRKYQFSEIDIILNKKSKIKTIHVHFKFEYMIDFKNKEKNIDNGKNLIDYSNGLAISYWFQKKKIETLINLINEKNSKCRFAVKDKIVPIELFLYML